MGSLEVLKTKATQVTILWTEKIESVKLFLKILDYKCHLFVSNLNCIVYFSTILMQTNLEKLDKICGRIPSCKHVLNKYVNKYRFGTFL